MEYYVAPILRYLMDFILSFAYKYLKSIPYSYTRTLVISRADEVRNFFCFLFFQGIQCSANSKVLQYFAFKYLKSFLTVILEHWLFLSIFFLWRKRIRKYAFLPFFDNDRPDTTWWLRGVFSCETTNKQPASFYILFKDWMLITAIGCEIKKNITITTNLLP